MLPQSKPPDPRRPADEHLSDTPEFPDDRSGPGREGKARKKRLMAQWPDSDSPTETSIDPSRQDEEFDDASVQGISEAVIQPRKRQ